MISYLGFPLLWPDNEIYGTICILDNKENHYNNDCIKLLEILRDSIEKDLELLLEQSKIRTELESKSSLRESI
jgi:GAF domain-containing protein